MDARNGSRFAVRFVITNVGFIMPQSMIAAMFTYMQRQGHNFDQITAAHIGGVMLPAEGRYLAGQIIRVRMQERKKHQEWQ